MALGAVAFVYVCSKNSIIVSADGRQIGFRMRVFFAPNNMSSPNNNTMSCAHLMCMPQTWTNDLQRTEELLQKATLYIVQEESAAQVKVLESGVFCNTDFSADVMTDYTATNATNTRAYAVLPFNAQPNS